MKRIRIAHKKQECIGCALCAEVAPAYFKMDEEGEAQLVQIVHQDATFQYGTGFEEDRDILKQAADGCPVDIIRVDC
ncbi:ferredoxin [Puniceicoccales bacterium CK1056]|uniref:Ferredoxin n=1 Tax=Oceanipulchritudo coccoides TaxID=2706888 RepID=A0A6B2LXZ1_9BACT|nr:ferredoxin [Oceanipulchritudo coccoides]NDV60916.1 ferredoxin [Oceanipulchritudo coccoides]